MLVCRCPHCELPLLADEITDGLCPSCGSLVEEPVEIVEPEPGPVPPSTSGWARFLLAGLAGALLALLIAWPISTLLQAGSLGHDEAEALRQESADAEKVAQTAVAGRMAAEKRLSATEITLREKETAFQQAQAAKDKAEQGLAKALGQLKNTGARTAQIEEQFTQLKQEFAALLAAHPPAPVATINLNQPDRDYNVPNLDRGRNLKLVGRVKTLRINSINNGALLDASELQAREILVSGTINGGARVRLLAPDGKVTVQEINGRSVVEIRAPGGSILVRTINGDAQVTLTAKEIDLANFIDGARTLVKATLTPGGHLHFADLRGASHLQWKKEKATDPEPRIDKGAIKPAAEFRKID